MINNKTIRASSENNILCALRAFAVQKDFQKMASNIIYALNGN